MRRVLLVDGDSTRSDANRAALTTAGHDVTLAPSGAFALTMVERARPDVVVSWAALEDMPAYELCAIVRSDPMTREIPFILLSERCASAPDALVRAIAELPSMEDASAGGGASDTSAHNGDNRSQDPPAAQASPEAANTSDPLTTTELEEAFQLVTEGKKTGRLVVCVGEAEGRLLFKAGRLVEADFQGQRGEPAVASLLVAATNNTTGRYRFSPWDGSEIPRRRWAIDHDAEQLLLRTWTERDAA